jgi:hypothetical protein
MNKSDCIPGGSILEYILQGDVEMAAVVIDIQD